jgi:hypothetical protein
LFFRLPARLTTGSPNQVTLHTAPWSGLRSVRSTADLEAEQAVLGAFFVADETWQSVGETFSPEVFYLVAHQAIAQGGRLRRALHRIAAPRIPRPRPSSRREPSATRTHRVWLVLQPRATSPGNRAAPPGRVRLPCPVAGFRTRSCCPGSPDARRAPSRLPSRRMRPCGGPDASGSQHSHWGSTTIRESVY